MAGALKVTFEEFMAELERRGLMLVHDNVFPSLTRMTIGEQIRGSWWAHPLANDVYMMSQRIQHSGEVMLTKLVSEKETYVHRRLWPQIVAVGIAREPWQIGSLAAGAAGLLKEVDERGSIRIDELSTARPRKEVNADARTLAARLLVFADDVHTEWGTHARRLETWRSWAKRHEIAMASLPSASAAREEFDRIVDDANREFSASGFLPWQKERARK